MSDYKALYEQAIAETVPKNQYNAVTAHLLGENNLLKKKLAEAEEFKKNAEETCEAYAVTDSLMKQIEQKDLDIKNIYEHHEKQLKVSVDLQNLLKEQMEDMYDEDGIRDNLDMLGLVDEDEHEEKVMELKDEIDSLQEALNIVKEENQVNRVRAQTLRHTLQEQLKKK